VVVMNVSRLADRRRRAGALLVIGIAVIAAASFIYIRETTALPAPNTFGEPQKGKTLAVVHVGDKTAYFPDVACESSDPEVITVSVGIRDDPISFYLASFLGPQAPDGKYISPMTSLVLGHRPGIALDQQGSGWVSVSPELQVALLSTRQSSNIEIGSLTFHGTDRTGALLNGIIMCGPTN
jgi:hypothetical protein